MSKEVKPREWYLNFGTSLGVVVRNPNQFNQAKFPRDKDYQEAAIHVIEYTPEVKRAVELSAGLLELLEKVIQTGERHHMNYFGYDYTAKLNELYNRSKGQA
jgi:hypothetical protein